MRTSAALTGSYGSVTASFCCEGFGLNATVEATRKAIDRARQGIGKTDEVLETQLSYE
jgi:hypothetical protein